MERRSQESLRDLHIILLSQCCPVTSDTTPPPFATSLFRQITLPIGVSSCYKAWTNVGDERARGGSTKKVDVLSLISGGSAQGTRTRAAVQKVVPCEETKCAEGNSLVACKT